MVFTFRSKNRRIFALSLWRTWPTQPYSVITRIAESSPFSSSSSKVTAQDPSSFSAISRRICCRSVLSSFLKVTPATGNLSCRYLFFRACSSLTLLSSSTLLASSARASFFLAASMASSFRLASAASAFFALDRIQIVSPAKTAVTAAVAGHLTKSSYMGEVRFAIKPMPNRIVRASIHFQPFLFFT